ncbi:hypothetical protein [uncultured Rubinisphaera sp.]|uniref:hypothetical protein n=1 Tax=uncultured Rubinisphaera sp. TaxID=1678686 RepID=UPI0030DD6916
MPVQHSLFTDKSDRIRDQAKVSKILQPFVSDLATSVVKGYTDVYAFVSSEGIGRASNCSLANLLNCYIIERAKERFVSLEQVQICKQMNIFKLIINDEIVVRFKKLRQDYTVMPSRTKQSRDWFTNCPIAGIPDHLLRVNVGYQLNQDHDIVDIAVTHQSTTECVAWRFSIWEEADISNMFDGYAPEAQEHIPIPLTLKSELALRKSV